MGKRAEPAASGIVTSDSIRHRYLGGRQLLLVGLLMVVVVAGASAAYIVRNGLFSSKPTTQTAGSKPTLTPAQQLTQAQSEVSQATTDPEKATAYSHLGAAYQTNNQYAQAATAYQQSLDNRPTSANQSHVVQSQTIATLSDLAYAYQQAGQQDKSVQAYQQIIAILEKSSDSGDQKLIPLYQSLIDDELNGGAGQ